MTAQPREWGACTNWADDALGAWESQPEERGGPLFEPATGLLNEDLSGSKWLVDGIVPERAVVALAGPPKSAKTWQAADIALAVATGTKALGTFGAFAARTVAMFLAEDHAADVRDRLCILSRGRDLEPQSALRRVHVCCRRRLNLLSRSDLLWLLASLRALPHLPSLVVLDPLVNVATVKSENDAGEMVQVTNALRCIRDIGKTAVLFVHHTKKPKEGMEQQKAGFLMRGSSVLYGAVDAGMYMVKARQADPPVWENEMMMEARALKAVGKVTVRLELLGTGSGQSARWVSAATEVATKATSAETVRAVLEVRGAALTPLKRIRAECKLGTQAVTAALADLVAADDVEHVAGKGYRLKT